VLTDQFLLDSLFLVEDMRLAQYAPEFHIADPFVIDDYHRYRVTKTGISPRLYPGQSRHLVTADSDEHDSRGHITEDLSETVPAMVEKRLAKHRALKAAVRPPGGGQYRGSGADSGGLGLFAPGPVGSP